MLCPFVLPKQKPSVGRSCRHLEHCVFNMSWLGMEGRTCIALFCTAAASSIKVLQMDPSRGSGPCPVQHVSIQKPRPKAIDLRSRQLTKQHSGRPPANLFFQATNGNYHLVSLHLAAFISRLRKSVLAIIICTAFQCQYAGHVAWHEDLLRSSWPCVVPALAHWLTCRCRLLSTCYKLRNDTNHHTAQPKCG